MTTPLGIRSVWKSLIVVATIGLAGAWWALTPRWVCSDPIAVDVLPPPPTAPPTPADDGGLNGTDISIGMRPTKALVQACYDHYRVPGVANVQLDISPEGTVPGAHVYGAFGGTPTGACVAAAVRHALFRPSRTTTNIHYWFTLGPIHRQDEIECCSLGGCPGDRSAPDPNQLTKSDIVAGMGKIKGHVGDCYRQSQVPGLANVSVTIAATGHVISAHVSGAFAGTPTGACVEAVVKTATFPSSKVPISINYPFMLR